MLCHETVDMPVVLWVVTLENGNQRFGCYLVKERPYLQAGNLKRKKPPILKMLNLR